MLEVFSPNESIMRTLFLVNFLTLKMGDRQLLTGEQQRTGISCPKGEDTLKYFFQSILCKLPINIHEIDFQNFPYRERLSY